MGRRTAMPALRRLALLSLMGGVGCSTPPDLYGYKCHTVLSKVAGRAMTEIEEISERVARGEPCPDLGAKADSICNQALEQFSTEAPDTEDDPAKETLYDDKVEELERTLDLPLQIVFMKQLTLLREKALQQYRASAKKSEQADYSAQMAADNFFAKEAEAAIRQGSSWDYARERQSLQATMQELANRAKKVTEAQLKAGQSQSTAFQFLQAQQQQIASLQQQMFGSASPWNLGVAYRIPDTNINLAGAYQGGRATVTFSCVPDEHSSMLGANGFSHGVGPGNLGLTVNLNI